jgi:hypothetical protein
MAVTRIKNNQITDATITAAKIASQTLVGSLFATDLTLNSNLSVIGNLTVTGTSSNINAINTFISDPFVIFNNGYTGSLTNYTIGILVNRNLASLNSFGSVNTAWVWNEADSAFTGIATTDTGTGVVSLNNSGYANIKIGNLNAVTAVTASSITATTLNFTNAIATTLVATNFSSGNAVISGGYISGLANATITTGNAQSWYAATLNSTTGNITTLTATTINAGTTTSATLNATTGNITTLVAGTTTSATLNATTGNITTLGAGTTTTATLNSTNGNITTLGAGTTTSAVLNATTGNITTLGAGTTTTATLNATTGNITTLGAGTTTTATLNATTGNITTLGAGTTTTATLNATTGNITTLDTVTTTSATLNATTGNITTLGAGTTTTATLNATTGNITTLGAGTTTSAVLNTTTGNITSGRATHFVATNFSSGNAVITGGSVNNSAIGNTTPSTGAFTTLSASGATTFTNATQSDNSSTGAVVVTGGLGVGANLNVAGNVTITGNLLVLGNTTTLNVETLNVEDLNITVAANATSGAEANGAGLTVAGANATLTYLNADDSWNLNKKLNATTVGAATVNVTTGNITTLGAGTTTSATLNATTGNITTLGAGTTTSATLNATTGNITTLGAGTTTSTVLNSTTGNITTLTSTTVNAGTTTSATLNVTTGNITTLGVGTTTSTTLNATTGNITTLDTVTTTSTTLNATTANVTDGKATTLVATNFSSGNAVISGGSINNTVIGNTTPVAATVTLLKATGNIVAASGVNATNYTTGALVVPNGGGVGITGDLWVQGPSTFQGNINAGNIQLSGNINVPVGGTLSSFGVFYGNAGGIGALYAGTTTYTPLPTTVFQMTGNVNSYAQTNFQNLNSGASATTDYILTSDNGVDNGYYGDFGILSSAYDGTLLESYENGIGSAGFPNDTYLYAHGDHTNPGIGGNLLIGSAVPGTVIRAFAGGMNIADVVTTTTNSGFQINAATQSTSSTSGALRVTGGAGVGGNLNVGYSAIFNTTKTANYDFIVRGDNDDTLIWARPSSTYDSVVIGNSATTSTLVTGAKLIVNTTDSMLIPVGSTAQRPGSTGGTDTAGMIRFNTSNAQLEFYNGSSWTNTGTSFTVIASETFDGDDVTTIFTLGAAATTQSVIVSLNGVLQIPSLAYTVSGTTLTFTQPPATGDKIEVRRLTTTATVGTFESGSGYVSFTATDSFANINAGTSSATTRMSFNTTGNVSMSANIQPSANVSYDIGNVNSWFKNIFVSKTVTSGADLAENYLADAVYPAGTVVEFGGEAEVTVSMTEGSVRVAGVVSSDPAHVMNGGLRGSSVVSIALVGRVPVNVIGPVYKGDMLISAGYGYARACAAPVIGSVIGKAVANFEGEKGLVEVVVGRL